tara:strand:+ start:179 stop:475 length:297 start_codon:yes stop_codon:yes gene_type:complete
MHALNARNITARGNNPASAPANNNGFILQVGIVSLFDGGIKRIAIYMRHAKLEKFVMYDKSWRFAHAAASAVGQNLAARATVAAHTMRGGGAFSIRLG